MYLFLARISFFIITIAVIQLVVITSKICGFRTSGYQKQVIIGTLSLASYICGEY